MTDWTVVQVFFTRWCNIADQQRLAAPWPAFFAGNVPHLR